MIPPARLLSCWCGVGLLLCAGCGGIETKYGKRADGSVNGTEVFSQLVEEAGHEVKSWPVLSPQLKVEADVIVWFPNDPRVPSEEVREWLEDWLLDRDDRLLIYVGRDYDAAMTYWQQIRAGTTGDDYNRLTRKLATARDEHLARQSTVAASQEADWFEVDAAAPRRDVRTLSGAARWVDGIDAQALWMELASRYRPPPDAQVLLQSEGDALVTCADWGRSRLLTVTNGSFLLNLPLVNQQQRKLAARLVDELGAKPKKVYFLESYLPEALVYDKDPEPRSLTSTGFFGVFPLNFILLQLAIAGALFVLSRLPIFGVPRSLEADNLLDFSQHVEALGDLLRASGDEAFARQRLSHYQAGLRGEAPPTVAAHASPAARPAGGERVDGSH